MINNNNKYNNQYNGQLNINNSAITELNSNKL